MTSLRLFVLTALSVLSTICTAQNIPQWELFGGYQFTSNGTGKIQDGLNIVTNSLGVPELNVGRHLNGSGWNVSLQENKASWFGGVVDFSGNYPTKNVSLDPLLQALGIDTGGMSATLRVSPTLYTFAGGPQFTYRRSSRCQPFARILFGGVHTSVKVRASISNIGILVPSDLIPAMSDTAFALLGGGGLDYHLGHSLAVRVSGDYVRSYLFEDVQNSVRISVGLVYRIGAK